VYNNSIIFETLYNCAPELEILTIGSNAHPMNLDIFHLAHLKHLTHFATKCGRLVEEVAKYASRKGISLPWQTLDMTHASEPHPANMSGALTGLCNLKVLVATYASGCPKKIDCGECFPASLEVLYLGNSMSLWSITGMDKMPNINEMNLFRNPNLTTIKDLENARGLRRLYFDHDDAINSSTRSTPIGRTVEYFRKETQIVVHTTVRDLPPSDWVRCWSECTMPVLSNIPDPFVPPLYYPHDVRLG
jgi:hypothetical protein